MLRCARSYALESLAQTAGAVGFLIIFPLPFRLLPLLNGTTRRAQMQAQGCLQQEFPFLQHLLLGVLEGGGMIKRQNPMIRSSVHQKIRASTPAKAPQNAPRGGCRYFLSPPLPLHAC